jgi:serine/threonine protein kinase
MKLIKSNFINNDYNRQQFDSNTYKSKRKNNLNNSIIKNEKEEEEEDEILEEKTEDLTPDDIVLVDCIDKMESIPLNHSIFKTPLLYNNIQQKLKYFLFRGRLPIFKVENYTIQKTLGEGTNGVIYQVINNKSKKPYAMKKLIGNSISELERFQKEFQICHQNPHPYILDIHGVCARCFDSTTYVLYVLMDLAEKDLDSEIADRCKIKKYYKEKELISMLKNLVSALFYLQKEKNIAHRDIKPENILLFKEGKVLKLADFGEAKLNSENRKMTIRGTEFYMSPILYEGNLKSEYVIQHNPFKSDVFSLGYCFILATALDPQVIKEIRQVKERFKIEQILKKFFQNRYTNKYIQLLLRMITIDENQRVDFIELNKILQNY